MSKISVVVATKNEERNIERLLISIVNQTFKDWEIIVVDNNSSDKTKEIALKYTDKVFNKGPERSAQRNFGVKKAHGQYVLILDADMELTDQVLMDCVRIMKNKKYKALVIAEKTVGQGMMAKIRAFERSMYMGDMSVEVARFFERKVFDEFGGDDLNLTGAEDYDLPYRISKKYEIGRSKKWIYHYESDLGFWRQLNKKYYYAKRSARYVNKHPEMVRQQGILFLRKAYLRHWKKFIAKPGLSIIFLLVRISETLAAALGYLAAVGWRQFMVSLTYIFKNH